MSAFSIKATVNGVDSHPVEVFTDNNNEVENRKIVVTCLRILADNLEAHHDDEWWMRGWRT